MAVKLNTKTSVVDYLKSQGQDSSMDARKKLAEGYGMSNYNGAYDQNIQLRKLLENDAQKSVAIAEVGGAIGKDKSGSGKKKDEGAKAEGVDSVATPTQGTVPQVAGVSQEVWDAINTPFVASDAYAKAWEYTEGLRSQLASGRTSYTDQIQALMAQIQGREDFSYDMSQDTLFQQSLASAMASGKTAMQDTIGQASALTGGYGSTYATSAGNGAYNAYIQDAYANLPEYYQMALEAYQMEGQEMYDQLGMLNTADATEYGRMYDAWNASYTTAQNLYAQEYGAWQDSINNAIGMGNLQLDEQGMLFDQENTLWEQKYKEEWAERDDAYRYDALKQDEAQHSASLAETKRQYDTSLAEERSQFVAKYDVNGDGVVDSKDQVTASDTGLDYTEITQTLYDIWKREGADSAMIYLDTLNISEGDPLGDQITEFIKNNIGYADEEQGILNSGGYEEDDVPLRLREFTVTDMSMFGNVKKVKDQFNIEYDIDDLPADIASELKKLKKGQSYKSSK